MAELKIVYWHDIPGQVVTRKGRNNKRIRLSRKFTEAIERASYRLKKQGKDADFEPWHQVEQAFDGDVESAAKELILQIEEQYTAETLDQLIRSNGFKNPQETMSVN